MTTYVRLISPTEIQPVPQTWRWPDGTTTSNFPLSPPEVLAAAGFLPLVEGAVPTPSSTQVVAPPTYTSNGSTVTSTYTLAAKPATQINAETINAALAALVDVASSARTAVTNNQTYLAIGAPSNAQVVAQVRALTQQMNVVIPRLLQLARLTIGALSADS